MMDKRLPENTVVQFNYLSAVRAQLTLHGGNAWNAILATDSVAMYELVDPEDMAITPGILAPCEVTDWYNLYPIYLRGIAYLKLHQSEQAAQEFQKILGHRGIVRNNTWGALAHLQLGRAQAIMGDKVAARKSYNDFLVLWKDADPDIPIYQRAKAEYAKLK